MTRQPIRNRLVLVGVLIIVTIIGATGLIILMQRLASIDAFRTATLNLGNGMAQQTTQALKSIDGALLEIQAGLRSAPDATVEEIQATMRSRSMFDLLVDQRKLLPGVSSLILVGAYGRTLNTSVGWPAVPVDMSGQDVFAHFLIENDHGAFVGAPVEDEVSGKWTAYLARRVESGHGRFAGLVVAEVSLSGLQAFYQLAMPGRRSVYLTRRDGLVLVRYPPRHAEIGQKIPLSSPWYGIVAKNGGSYHAAGYFDGTSVIAAVHPLANLPFVVEAAVTEADALSEWYQQRIWVIMGSIAAAVGVILLLRLFGSQYRRVELSELSLARKNVELDTAHRQLDATLANLSQGVCFYNDNKKLIVFNRRYCELYDLSPDTVHAGLSLREISELRIAAGSFTSQTIEEYLYVVEMILHDVEPHDSIHELTNGRVVSVYLQPLPGSGWVATHEDITERREAEAKIAFLARHDVLTGLANRALFQERLEHAAALTARGIGFAVLCLDLDRFKAVNDTYGHPVGDALLRSVADRLRAAVRDGDTVARLGGDEFAILQLGVSDVAEVTVVARRIVQSLCEIFDLDGRQVSVGTSVGIAMAPGDSTNSVQLMKHADLALYRAKQEGRGTWRFFESTMDSVAAARRALEADLKIALPLGQLQLHYQPLLNARERSVSAFEALLRWNHPTRGMVAPGEFISVAEEVGLIEEIGAWVLQQACAEAANWPVHIRVSVNLSTRQFRGHALVGTVADAVRAAGIVPERLELEITESVPLQKDQATLSTLRALHGLGVRIALDDFGTGYSSLSYLRSFPFDTIKIDRSFVSDLQLRDEGAAIVGGIIGLASSLRMNVTAEGVETVGQFEYLAAAGCTDIQGYLISRPVPAAEVPALLKALTRRYGRNAGAKEAEAALDMADVN
jgi:diguanylate cyclase (GGDEF)-like protein